MKVASIEWQKSEWEKISKREILIQKIEEYLEKAVEVQADVVVFPGFTGCFYQQISQLKSGLQELKKEIDSGEYIEQIRNLSMKYEIALCPGSYWEKDGQRIYHTSIIILNGKILLKQRQVYLARWERNLGLSRGVVINLEQIKGWKVGIVMSTDVFYPQVSRMLALIGAGLVLSPVGFIGERNQALQISGMWQNVQQNSFFAVESGFNGFLGGLDFWGESMVHAPLAMTEAEDGWLARSKGQQDLIAAELDNDLRSEAISRFDVLSQLNPEFYRRMKIFGGRS